METIKKPTSDFAAITSYNAFNRTRPSVSFDDVIAQYAKSSQAQQAKDTSTTQPVLVGKISSQNPTVSELLLQHDDLGPSTWDIILSAENKSKDFTKIRPGTNIYYNPADGALSWSSGKSQTPATNKPSLMPSLPPSPVAQSIANTEQKDLRGSQIEIGKISSDTPTVSHLLKNHPQFKEEAWNILANKINKDKSFHTIPAGTELYVDRTTMEISWGKRATTETIHQSTPFVAETTTISPADSKRYVSPATNLSEAVQKYLGTSYEEINCYELLVKGLGQMNIPYSGKNGLYTELRKMAVDQGMKPNAYLNGEGIVKAAGKLVLSKNYSGQGNWEDEAASLIQEIEPILNNGQILSFSMEKRGHTGVVSRQNDQWTFINSGRLDNPVDKGRVNKGVGEEVLREEIRNWYQLAHSNNERLQVSLGQLDHDKIRTTLKIADLSVPTNQTFTKG